MTSVATSTTPERSRAGWLVVTLMVATVALAAGLRLHRLSELPPGLFIDQAQYGLDAWAIAQGERLPIYVEGPGANKARGREPLFMYLMALIFRIAGPAPYTIKLTSALIGIAAVAITGVAAGRWLGPRVGILAAFLMAVSRWHLTFSRMGFRAILTPLWVSLVMLALWWLARRRTRGAALLFGAALGGGFYTYPAYWSVPPALATIALAAWWEARGARTRGGRSDSAVAVPDASARVPPEPEPPAAPGAASPRRAGATGIAGLARAAALSAAVVAAPLGLWVAFHAEDFLARAREVAIVGERPANVPERPETTFLDGLQRVVFMLHLRGDQQVRHNIPGRPMLDLASGLAFLAGLAAIAKGRLPRSRAVGLVALWLFPLLPSAVTEAAPSALRTVGAIPAVCVIAAVGLDALAELCGRRWGGRGRLAASALLATTLVVAAVLNLRAYFVEWAAIPEVASEYSADIPRFVDYLGELSAGADVTVCPYVYYSPNVRFLTLERDPPLRPLAEVSDLYADGSGRDRVFVCDEPAMNALLLRLYPEAAEVGRYAIYSASNGRILRVPGSRLRSGLVPGEEEQARYFVRRMNEDFAERSKTW